MSELLAARDAAASTGAAQMVELRLDGVERPDVAAALRAKGMAGLNGLRVAASDAVAVVWTSPTPLDSGATASFSYKLSGVTSVKIVNRVFGPTFTESDTLKFGSDVLLPFVSR